jgi:DNA-binding NtrC family response regulator
VTAPGSVLLVDDEERLLRHLGRALRAEGHEIVTATSVAEAQERLAERGFDVLVVDNLMPGGTGLELIRDLATA